MPSKTRKKTNPDAGLRCPGSDEKPAKGSRRRSTGHRSNVFNSAYLCNHCQKYVIIKVDGTFRKHNMPAKVEPKLKVKIKKGCAICKADLYEIDYLCPKCREIQNF